MSYFKPDKINSGVLGLDIVYAQIEEAYEKINSCNNCLNYLIKENLDYSISNIADKVSKNLRTSKEMQNKIIDVIDDYNKTMRLTTENSIDLNSILQMSEDFCSFLEHSSSSMLKTLQNGWDVLYDVASDTGAKFVGDVKSWFTNLYETNIVYRTAASTGASIINTGISFLSGAAKFVEGLFDGAFLSLATLAVPITGLIDMSWNCLTGENLGLTDAMLENTRGVVQYNAVQSWCDWLYNTDFGKTINDCSFPSFKRDGAIYNLTNQAGTLVTPILLSAALAYFGVSPSVSLPLLAGISSFGNTTENFWRNGSGTVEGMSAGFLDGLYNAFQWAIGGKLEGTGAKAILFYGVGGFIEPLFQSSLFGFATGDDILKVYNDSGGLMASLQSAFLSGIIAGWGEHSYNTTLNTQRLEEINTKKIDLDVINNKISEINIEKNIDSDTISSFSNIVNFYKVNGKAPGAYSVDEINNFLKKYSKEGFDTFNFLNCSVKAEQKSVIHDIRSDLTYVGTEKGKIGNTELTFNVLQDSDGIRYRIQNSDVNNHFRLDEIYDSVSKVKAFSESGDLMKNVKQIDIVSVKNPGDEYWAKFHGDGTFTSAATFDNGYVTIYKLSSPIDQIIAHEAGHGIDKNNILSGSDLWAKAAELDGNFASAYARSYRNGAVENGAKNLYIEDFADSIKNLYSLGFERFRRKYPNRAKLLELLF